MDLRMFCMYHYESSSSSPFSSSSWVGFCCFIHAFRTSSKLTTPISSWSFPPSFSVWPHIHKYLALLTADNNADQSGNLSIHTLIKLHLASPAAVKLSNWNTPTANRARFFKLEQPDVLGHHRAYNYTFHFGDVSHGRLEAFARFVEANVILLSPAKPHVVTWRLEGK